METSIDDQSSSSIIDHNNNNNNTSTNNNNNINNNNHESDSDLDESLWNAVLTSTKGDEDEINNGMCSSDNNGRTNGRPCVQLDENKIGETLRKKQGT